MAQGQRQALLAHRDGARLIAGTRPFDPLFHVMETMIESLVAVGFTPGQALRGATTMSMFVGGFVLEEQAEQRRWQEEGVAESDEEAFFRLRDTGKWPMVVAAFAESGDPNGEEAFADGIGMIIQGMAAVLAGEPRPPA